MKHRALLLAALVLSLGAASAAPSAFEVAPAAAISVRAGVGGTARPGRWLPVDVAISAGDAALRGSLLIEWGGAIARRDIDMAAASTTRVTLLVRTIAATPAVRVILSDAAGATIASSMTPVTLLPVDDSATLCIGDVAPSASCAVRIPESEAPATWRAFDLADEVIWNAKSTPPRITSEAFALWQAARWWQNSGFVDPVVAPFDTNSRLADRTSLSLGLFVAALLVISALVAWRRAPALLLAGAPLLVVAGGVALVTRSSRDVDIQAASFVHQFAGVSQSIVLMKGDVEHPGAQPVELLPAVDDASLDIVRGLQYSDSTAATDGRAVYRHTAGRGVSQRFQLNGTLGQEWLVVNPRGGSLVIENHSALSLASCELRSENVTEVGAIAPGAAATIAAPGALQPGDAVVCELPAGWMKWSAPGATVSSRGSAFLIFHMWPGTAGTGTVPVASR